MAYNRYTKFNIGNETKVVPFIAIPERATDIYIDYKRENMRLDLISYDYYGDSSYGWLILQANPELSSMEFKIKNHSQLRIPNPLNDVIRGYEDDIDTYIKLYGLDY